MFYYNKILVMQITGIWICEFWNLGTRVKFDTQTTYTCFKRVIGLFPTLSMSNFEFSLMILS